MFQTKLKELREAAGYKSQQAFANAFGVAQSTVGGWESGKREPNFDTILRLAQYFGVTVDYLLGTESKDEYSAKFRENLSKILGTLDGFTSSDSEAMCDFRELEAITESAYPLSLAEACDAADKIGESISYLLQDDIENSDPSEVEKTPTPEAGDGREAEAKRLFEALPDEGKISALNYLRYLAANSDNQSHAAGQQGTDEQK